jgi:hypothetical protein
MWKIPLCQNEHLPRGARSGALYICQSGTRSGEKCERMLARIVRIGGRPARESRQCTSVGCNKDPHRQARTTEPVHERRRQCRPRPPSMHPNMAAVVQYPAAFGSREKCRSDSRQGLVARAQVGVVGWSLSGRTKPVRALLSLL